MAQTPLTRFRCIRPWRAWLLCLLALSAQFAAAEHLADVDCVDAHCLQCVLIVEDESVVDTAVSAAVVVESPNDAAPRGSDYQRRTEADTTIRAPPPFSF